MTKKEIKELFAFIDSPLSKFIVTIGADPMVAPNISRLFHST